MWLRNQHIILLHTQCGYFVPFHDKTAQRCSENVGVSGFTTKVQLRETKVVFIGNSSCR